MKVKVLGTVQDGGVPHLGCRCDVCEEARQNPDNQRYNASIMVVSNASEASTRYLVDATPDIRYQIEGEYLDGVFVSHGGLGHITGLLHLGEEGMDAEMVQVYATEETQDFLRENDPYRLLIDRNNVDLNTIEDGYTQELQGGKIEALQTRHTGVNTDSLGYMIHGDEKKLFYMSDIHAWNEKSLEAVKEADIAIIDGTFWNEEEIDRYHEVPHPVMKETMHKTEDWDTEIVFTHLNHTNPALRPHTQERQEIKERGFQVAERGMEFEI